MSPEHLTTAATRVMRAAYADEVVNTVLPQFDSLDTRIFKHLRQQKLFGPPTKKPGWERPWQNPRAQRYYEHSYRHTLQNVLVPEWLVETARFPVPYGSIGVVKSFDQQIASGASYITQYSNWGRLQSIGATYAIRWYFRLYPFSGPQPPRYTANTLALPGVPYPDHPTQDYILHPVNAAGNDVHWLIPGGQMLRVFFWTPADNTRWQIWARLRGYLQSGYSAEAAHNARSGW